MLTDRIHFKAKTSLQNRPTHEEFLCHSESGMKATEPTSRWRHRAIDRPRPLCPRILISLLANSSPFSVACEAVKCHFGDQARFSKFAQSVKIFSECSGISLLRGSTMLGEISNFSFHLQRVPGGEAQRAVDGRIYSFLLQDGWGWGKFMGKSYEFPPACDPWISRSWSDAALDFRRNSSSAYASDT